jgi:preprotein translocase subunit SecD
MATYARLVALSIIAGLVFALAGLAGDQSKTKVEFRRAETKPAEGLTEEIIVGTKDKVYLHKAVDLTAEDISSARLAGEGKDRIVEITFTEAGAKKAAKLSQEHAEKAVAIVVGGKVIAAPIIRARLGDSIVISGPFDEVEARKLVKAIGGK